MDRDRCPLCLSKGKTRHLQWQSLDLERKILLCQSTECTFPFGTKFFDRCLAHKTENCQINTMQWHEKEDSSTFVSDNTKLAIYATESTLSDIEKKKPSKTLSTEESNIANIATKNHATSRLETTVDKDSCQDIIKSSNREESVNGHYSSTSIDCSSYDNLNGYPEISDLDKLVNTDEPQKEKDDVCRNVSYNKDTFLSYGLHIMQNRGHTNNQPNYQDVIYDRNFINQNYKSNNLTGLSKDVKNDMEHQDYQKDNKIATVIETNKRKLPKAPISTIRYKPYVAGIPDQLNKKSCTDSSTGKKGPSLLRILDRNPLARMSRENIPVTDLPAKMLDEILKEKSTQGRIAQDTVNPTLMCKSSDCDENASDNNLITHARCDTDDTTYSTSQVSPADSGFSSLPDSLANTPAVSNHGNSIMTANTQFLEELDALMPDITEDVPFIST
ncbi:uncharacterized protein TRIADDRAFT_58427 [Trichoplax adhaerens]|uniref:Uncharacterized protein n=1 Tax=Trichoplax adhaerens TaxID=10228 RepID=B3S298_TRIAD|nr:hypothetical protein TRIADDRAFT_58427 [Trichoplax adhaerens]EDV23609.1 hypothetical protein TRIADDRAFT_58427 [Trichoplax adhaerens]|eukprot:XP_002114519.1 hypothetical protein TRIADDRAFT_58427 [Trichoplax adhaerens]